VHDAQVTLFDPPVRFLCRGAPTSTLCAWVQLSLSGSNNQRISLLRYHGKTISALRVRKLKCAAKTFQRSHRFRVCGFDRASITITHRVQGTKHSAQKACACCARVISWRPTKPSSSSSWSLSSTNRCEPFDIIGPRSALPRPCPTRSSHARLMSIMRFFGPSPTPRCGRTRVNQRGRMIGRAPAWRHRSTPSSREAFGRNARTAWGPTANRYSGTKPPRKRGQKVMSSIRQKSAPPYQKRVLRSGRYMPSGHGPMWNNLRSDHGSISG